MTKFNSQKFVFHELFTNTNGKTSASGFIGVVLGLISAAAFITAMFGYWFDVPNTVEIMGQILKLVAASTLLLGIRKVAPRFGNNGTENNDINSEEIVDISKKK